MKNLKTKQFQGLNGSLLLPGDKSISHRSIMVDSISWGISRIKNFSNSTDCLSTLNAFLDLGVEIKKYGRDLIVYGSGLDAFKDPKKPLNMGNSGTTTRLLLGLLAGQSFNTCLVGDASLSKRPMYRVTNPITEVGGEFSLTGNGTLPITVIGHPSLKAFDYHLPIASAQVKSALIFSALQADEPSIIFEKEATRNHLEIMLNDFGADIKTNGLCITVMPRPKLSGRTISIPGDISSAAFFMVAASLLPNSCICLKKVGLNPTRIGIISVLKRMNANIEVKKTSNEAEAYGDIIVRSSNLHAVEITAKEIPNVIDELPILTLAASLAKGRTIISGAGELRVKETDRISVVAAELKKLGARIQEKSDGMVIDGCPKLQIPENNLATHGDHRIGMMLAVAALLVDTSKTITLNNPEAIKISYPNFFRDLDYLLNNPDMKG
ncbi:3-phosphoshikimate 1-carboxyvinyltransferase [Oenococcus oeni]|uniref:3-phosphoshikimate 1-carboxyvinyltransferase n=1 Tax=Oenococcus oeni TaxID=1247 RepID=A0A6N4A9B8_OENOE|nr:3-phosphoshikimate 1-carboxyvinyltransferase [Oenococcus oeni]OIK57875.1 3-phosphoshikimate 1-carboxyvinyltransferase [Oenococcus oeni]OIL39575.1 3-phosphoshikimate 1-carboxyvinyltransferase [Oenococcus oeni]OIM22123.1 3-phosphoshikimate 1-carboxyvinyltransferase [Oenococcus oeni]OIM26579.1 3-phosphoshikimate 1-carboxyvinyltransferase [Oenococcus oeni]OIM64821.1 3-phosphoshikimate 1-carboxyvinyltransferase [Oenococcus oeni]